MLPKAIKIKSSFPIEEKFAVLLTFLLIPMLLYAIFVTANFWHKSVIQDNFLLNNDTIIRTSQMALNANNSASKNLMHFFLVKAATTQNIEGQKILFDNAINEYQAAINALAWGTETLAFKKASGGISFKYWALKDLDKKLIIKHVPPGLRQTSGVSDIVFAGFIKYAHLGFRYLIDYLTLQSQGKNIQAANAYSQALQHIRTAEHFHNLTNIKLSEVILLAQKMNVEHIKNLRSGQITSLVGIALIGLILYILINLIGRGLVKKGLVNPLLHIIDRIVKVADGQTDIEAEIYSHDELGELATKFNQMVKNIQNIISSHNQMETIMGSISDMVFILDPGGNIKQVNQATLDNLGFSEIELLGKSIDKIILDVQGNKLKTQEQFVLNAEQTVFTKDNKRKRILFSSSSIFDPEGNLDGMICVARDISQLKQAEEKIDTLSRFDSLTKLPNRVYFEIALERELESAKKNHHRLALMYLDVDHLNLINGNLGYHVGDLLLQAVAKQLKEIIPKNWLLTRLAGDEFAIIVPDLQDPTEVGALAVKILNTFSNNTYELQGKEVNTSLSIGIANYPFAGNDTTELIKSTEIALRHAKELVRNNYQFFTFNLSKKFASHLKVKSALHDAIKNQEFFLVYQPIIAVATQKIMGAEALLRWNHPEMGIILPDEFLPVAELIGYMMPINEWVIRNVCQHCSMCRTFLHNCKINLNVMVSQLIQEKITPAIIKWINHAKVSPSNLVFEITENSAMFHLEKIGTVLKDLHQAGVGIAIDDFGSGFSSLNRLAQLSIDTLKIDGGFIQNIDIDKKHAMILKSIIALAQNLGLNVVCEGVETKKQWQFLLDNNCGFAQGFYFSKPVSLEEFITKLEQQNNGR